MPPTKGKSTPNPSLFLVCGDEEFGVKERAKEIFNGWTGSGLEGEIIDGAVTNQGEAFKALSRVREALFTLSFFSSEKAVWLQNCTFLADDRTSNSQELTQRLTDFAAELQKFDWKGVRLLISALKVDKRRSFYKTVEKFGTVEVISGWSLEDKDWMEQAEAWASAKMRELGKNLSSEALRHLVQSVGPNRRQLQSEVEKVALYLGNRSSGSIEDVDTIVVQNRNAQSFALADAVGARNLKATLHHLDRELWSMKSDSQRSEVGVLYGLIAKFRAMIFMKGLEKEGLIKSGGNYYSIKTQLESLPPDRIPDKKNSPMGMNPFVLFRALADSKNYSEEELIRNLELLLGCNQRLFSSSLDPSVILQTTLLQLVGTPAQGK